MKKKILVTGGLGFIGSHTIITLIEHEYVPIILDNLSNSHKDTLECLEKLTGVTIECIVGDIRDSNLLDKIFLKYSFSAVIHFAGLKSVNESIINPLHYYDNNVSGTLNLLSCMNKFNLKKIIFSSSATIYGNSVSIPLNEDAPRFAINPYGRSKLIVENILEDLCHKNDSWTVVSLRYFNPVGAHESGLIGENPQNIPNNLMPIILNVASKKTDYINIFGNDYPTPDGTCIRDYIHVMDLADGHVSALKYLFEHNHFSAMNLGTGYGVSVLKILKTFEEENNVSVPYKIVNRREGDIPISIANPALAKLEMNWVAKRSLKEMCKDSWNWKQKSI